MSNNIKKLRRARKLSQAQLGELVHIPQTRISKLELGHSKPDDIELNALSEYFRVSAAYVMGLTDDKYDYRFFDEEDIGIADLDNREKDLIAIYRSLDQIAKNHLILTAKMLESYFEK